MVDEQTKKEFKKRLENLQGIENIAIGRVYDRSSENLLAIIPNLPGKSGSLKVFYGSLYGNDSSIDLTKSLNIFGNELVNEAVGKNHPNIQLIKQALDDKRNLRLEVAVTNNTDLLNKIVNRTATLGEKFEGLQLLQAGQLRTAEKTYGIAGDKPLWEPQSYAIVTLNSGFGLFGMGTYPENPQFVDKIPLWSQDVNLEDGVHSSFKSEEELIKTGVRLIPGSFARIGAYIGKGTTIMPGGVVNIGAYVAGDGVMIDAGARVASGAQVGKGVKIGAGTGLEGVLEPAGMMPTIVEDNVRIGANCEITGIIGEGALIASGVVMASGKKIYDERTKDFLEPLYVETTDGLRSVPHIPANRIAVGGTYIPEGLRVGKDIIILLEKNAKDSSFMDVPKNPTLYLR